MDLEKLGKRRARKGPDLGIRTKRGEGYAGSCDLEKFDKEEERGQQQGKARGSWDLDKFRERRVIS